MEDVDAETAAPAPGTGTRERENDELRALSNDLVVHAARLVRAVRRQHPFPAGIRVLSLLDEHGATGVSALAALDRCSQPTMSNAVSQLVERGWVGKQPSPDDGRSTLVALSEAGRQELRRTRDLNASVVAERVAAGPHTTEDLATAVAVLRDLLDTEKGI